MPSLQPSTVNSPRCAIYTRKSFQPPIAQEITSLEAQRAICSSYIASQQHKHWVELEKHYDDAGISGASLERPALRDLIFDIENGLVEIVVVYKLDRISRTLLDFVRLMDFFERYGVVFVAITQNFDTSDSMGRLIRNVLLTFAQFEREIASDRMRDKRRLMKQRGLWAGGNPPLGYDLRRGKLVPNAVEAPAVRCIFETYVATHKTSEVMKALAAGGHRRMASKPAVSHASANGLITLSSLHHILRNAVYIGDVTYKGERFAGIHQPLVDRALWDAAQRVLKDREQLKPVDGGHVLTGVVFDAHGRRLHARTFYPRGKSRIRYYQSEIKAGEFGQRIRRTVAQADRLESLVVEALKGMLADPTRIRPVLMQADVFGSTLDALCRCGPAAAVRLGKLKVRQAASAFKALFARVEVADNCVRLVIRAFALAKLIGWDGVGYFSLTDLELARSTRMHVLVIPVAVNRHRRSSWLPVERRTSAKRPNPELLRLLKRARDAQDLLFHERDKSMHEIARMAGRRRVCAFSRLVRLNYLAPDIVAAIMDGTQPAGLTPRQLAQCDLPIDWQLQRRILGFPVRPDGAVMPRSRVAAAPVRD